MFRYLSVGVGVFGCLVLGVRLHFHGHARSRKRIRFLLSGLLLHVCNVCQCSPLQVTRTSHLSVPQSQVYRSQPDLVSAGYEPPGQTSSLMVDYSYGPYSDNVDRNQTFTDYQYPGGYSSESAWPAAEQG